MKLQSINLLLVLALLFISCDNTSNLEDCQNGAINSLGDCECSTGYEGTQCQISLNLIKEIYLNGELFRSFEYDSQNVLNKVIEYIGNNSMTIYNHFVYPDSTFVRIDNGFGESYLFDHSSSGSIFVKNEYSPNQFSTKKYTNLINNCGYSYRDESTSVINPFTYSIDYDENCNFVKSTFDQNGSLKATEEVELDGAKNIYQYNYYHAFDFDHPFVRDGGNFKNRRYTDEEGSILEHVSFNSIFEYNENDMPISQTQTFFDGRVDNYTYVYF